MDNYVINALFRLAVLVLLTSIDAVDVIINETTHYDGVHVVVLHEYLSCCLRHQPTEGAVVTRVLIGGTQDPSFVTSSPYLDVLIDGIRKYFKVENSNWSSSTPFRGNKYNYYKVKNSEVFPCDGLEYMKIYYQSFRRQFILILWRGQSHIQRHMVTEGRLSVPKPGVFIKKATAESFTLWEYDHDKGLLFVKAVERKIHRRAVAALYFKDLNDNEIKMHYMLWRKGASYLSPWKGWPKEYDAPPESLPCPSVSPRVEPIALTVDVARDIIDTPLMKVCNHGKGEKWMTAYIAHPDAHIQRFISPYHQQEFLDDNIIIVTYTGTHSILQFRALLYENHTTQLLEISNQEMTRTPTQVTDPSIIIYSFPLYLEAEVDERMYTRRMLTIGGVDSAVYTARPHLSFSQVYHDGVPVFVEGEKDIIMQQFILQDSRIYVVVRAESGIGHGRFFMGRDDNEWQRAKDEYPDYIIF